VVGTDLALIPAALYLGILGTLDLAALTAIPGAATVFGVSKSKTAMKSLWLRDCSGFISALRPRELRVRPPCSTGRVRFHARLYRRRRIEAQAVATNMPVLLWAFSFTDGSLYLRFLLLL
jgi:hypothetical protein